MNSIILSNTWGLQAASTPKETKAVEAISLAARAYAKEQGDYDMLVSATYAYIISRRKTTELILPEISHGGSQGNDVVTLKDYGFTKMQWSRRVQELAIPAEKVDEYFDECISKRWEPSKFGLISYQKELPATVPHEEWCNVNQPCNCRKVSK